MAQKVIVELVDDIDGSEAHDTVSFGLDGTVFEIDLSAQNAERLRLVLDPYIEAGRKTGAAPRQGRSRGGAPVVRSTADRDEAKRMREWALANGYEVSDRGRIPIDIVNAFNAAV